MVGASSSYQEILKSAQTPANSLDLPSSYNSTQNFNSFPRVYKNFQITFVVTLLLYLILDPIHLLAPMTPIQNMNRPDSTTQNSRNLLIT